MLQFRLAYVAPESRVVGAGDLVDDPKRIAKNYFFGYFFIDVFVVLPLPQVSTITILALLPYSLFITNLVRSIAGVNRKMRKLQNLCLECRSITYAPPLFSE